jgi:uncharacterized protein with FMN-binding domain
MLVLVGTAAGATALIGAKGGFGAARTPVLVVSAPDGPATAAPPARPTAAPAGQPAAGQQPAAAGGGARSATQQPGAANPGRSASSRPAGGAYQVTGERVDTPYGAVQVAVTFSGGRISAVRALAVPKSSARSVELSARAEPALRQETLRKQSARLAVVSGATYTSEGYARSLQNALDRNARGERG